MMLLSVYTCPKCSQMPLDRRHVMTNLKPPLIPLVMFPLRNDRIEATPQHWTINEY
jgi:hypothetical protein